MRNFITTAAAARPYFSTQTEVKFLYSKIAARSILRAFTPQPIKSMFDALRRAAQRPPIDDVVLGDYIMVKDGDPKPRLNIVLPRLEAGTDFGGFYTGIDFFLNLVKKTRETKQVDIRLIITDVIATTDANIFHRATGRFPGMGAVETLLVRSPKSRIPVRQHDIFMTYNWWTTLNINRLVKDQSQAFFQQDKPLLYIIQDYEPNFLSFSSAHMLARDALDIPDRLWAIFNSSNLANYARTLGHAPEHMFVFEPFLHTSLRPYLRTVGTQHRRKRIVVYGRPNVERNCFPALIRGLRRWVHDYPEYADWEVVSAGTPHKPVPLGGGRFLRSVGKLDIDAYAQLLLTSSVGLSLMASPHPSYPPLEMAHMGLKTVTNSYTCKDLSSFHPNIISIDTLQDATIATAIMNACLSSEKATQHPGNADYLRHTSYPIMNDIVSKLLREL